MREIKFRGKAKMTIEELNDMHFEHENGWFYGNLVMYGDAPYIVGDFIEVDEEYTANEFWVPVYPESVGQYTGFKDDWGNEVYEKDIFKDEDNFLWVVEHDGFHLVATGGEIHGSEMLHEFHSWQDGDKLDFLVVGNVFQNPELLEGAK